MPQNRRMREQLHIGNERPSEELFFPVKNRNFVKPSGGLWTSTVLPDGSSDWIRWCDSEEFLDTKKIKKWVLVPEDDIRVFTIYDSNDIKELCQGKILNPLFAIPDFEELAKRYDAIHLTGIGQIKTRFSHPFSFYGWDCESTLWLNWKFKDIKEIRR